MLVPLATAASSLREPLKNTIGPAPKTMLYRAPGTLSDYNSNDDNDIVGSRGRKIIGDYRHLRQGIYYKRVEDVDLGETRFQYVGGDEVETNTISNFPKEWDSTRKRVRQVAVQKSRLNMNMQELYGDVDADEEYEVYTPVSTRRIIGDYGIHKRQAKYYYNKPSLYRFGEPIYIEE